jgi:hypothetical protein
MVTIKPSQIVFLEHQDARLYTEVIQTAGFQRLWARPLMLVRGLPEDDYLRQQAISRAATDLNRCTLELYDLKAAPDLVWPQAAFNIAFDTDFFSLLFHLRVSDSTPENPIAQHQFNCFLQACWHQQSHSISSQTQIQG